VPPLSVAGVEQVAGIVEVSLVVVSCPPVGDVSVVMLSLLL